MKTKAISEINNSSLVVFRLQLIHMVVYELRVDLSKRSLCTSKSATLVVMSEPLNKGANNVKFGHLLFIGRF